MREPEKRTEGHSRKNILELEPKQALFQKRVAEKLPSLSNGHPIRRLSPSEVFFIRCRHACVLCHLRCIVLS